MASYREAESEELKIAICRLLCSVLKYAKEYNPLNAAQYCGTIVSIRGIVRELERVEMKIWKKKKTKN